MNLEWTLIKKGVICNPWNRHLLVEGEEDSNQEEFNRKITHEGFKLNLRG